MKVMTIMLIVILPVLAGTVALQIFLSKHQNRWLGLILPAIPFLNSILMITQIAAVDGQSILGMVLGVFVSCNIPTVIFLVIYFICREKYRKQSQLEKMNIQDL